MSLQQVIDPLFEKCETIDELRSEIVRILRERGEDASDGRIKVLMRGLFGGTRVEISEDGQFANRWRRKFLSGAPGKSMQSAA